MTTQIINNECWLSVNLNLLVKKRAEIQGIILDEEQTDYLANEMRVRATLDFLFEEVDNLLLVWANDDGQFMGESPYFHYGEITGEIPELKCATITGHNDNWELEVPILQ